MTEDELMQAAVDRLVDCHGVTEADARAAMTEAMRPTPIGETWQPIRGRDLGDRVQIERVDGELSPPIPKGDAGAVAAELQRRAPDRLRAFAMQTPFTVDQLADALSRVRAGKANP